MKNAVFNGVDLSHWNGNVDFEKLKKHGVSFVILKVGGNDSKEGKVYKDARFEEYWRKALEAGLNVGGYFFVGESALKNGSGLVDGMAFHKLIEGKVFQMPLYLDIERGGKTANAKERQTKYVEDFLNYMESRKYYMGVYGSDISTFKERLILERLTKYTWWVARYGKEPQYATKNCEMWQCSSTANIEGINGNVDWDVCFYNFPAIIKKVHLNGY